LTLTLLTVSGCATDSPAPINSIPPVRDTFCSIYVPVYTSARDTEETKRQVDKNNAVWLEKCAPAQPAPQPTPAPGRTTLDD